MPPAIFIDFDGVVVPCDVEFELYARFGGPDRAGDVVGRWERRQLDVPGRIRAGFAALQAAGLTPAELERFLDGIPLDPTFPPFLGFLRDRGWPGAILSDGLDWYIAGILRRHAVPGAAIPPIIANELRFDGRWQVRFPHRNGDCSPCRQCGTCKRYPIRDARAWADPVIFISDGRPDRWAAVECDVVFAKQPLLSILRGWGRPRRLFAFDNFDDVRREIERLLPKRHAS